MYNAIRTGAFAAIFVLGSHTCLAADGDPSPAKDKEAAVQPAAGDPMPRYIFHEGQVLDYTIKVDQHTRLPSGTAEPDFVLSSVATLDTEWTVRALKANGDAEIEIAVKRFVFTADAPMIAKIDADSAKPPDPARQPAASIYHVLSAVKNGTSRISVTPTGKVASFQWPKETANALANDETGELKGFFGDLFSAAGAQRYLTSPIAILPTEPLGPGGKWKSPAVVFGVECQDIYRIAPPLPDTAKDGVIKYEIATKVDVQGDHGSDLGISTMKFDVAHGRVASLERHHDLPISGPGVGHANVTIAVAFKEPAPKNADPAIRDAGGSK